MYRRRRYRRAYRRPTRTLRWCRDSVNLTTDVGAPNNYRVDLLFKFRSGDTIQNAASFAYDAADPKAALVTPLTTTEYENALVKRIRLHYVAGIAPFGAGTLADSVASAGAYEGILVLPGSKEGATTITGPFLSDTTATVARDWLWWNKRYMLWDYHKASSFVSGVTPDDWLMTNSIDTRCSRKLREIDESLYFFVEPTSGRTINELSVTWSVLLSIP